MKSSFASALVVLSAIAIAGCSSPLASSRRYIDSGDRYMKTAQWSAASIEYRNAIKRAPDVVEAHAKLATVATLLGDKQTAANERQWIAKKTPQDLDAQMAAGEACLIADRNDDAEAAFGRAVALAPQKPGPSRALASFYMQTDRPDKAESYWRTVAAAPDGDRFALADFYAAVNRTTDAEHELRTISAMPQHEDAALLRLSELFYAHDRSREGDETLSDLLVRYPHDEAAWLLRGQMLLRDGSDESQEAFLNALVSDPTSIDALTGMTLADVAAHRPGQAVARLEDHLRQTPDSIPLLMLAARTYAATESFDRAEATLAHAVRLEPANADAQALMGRVYLGEGRPEEARQAFERAASIAPNSVEANTLVGMLLQGRGHWPEARQRYERVLQTNPRAAVAANNLAWLDLEDGRLDDALRYGLVAHSELRGFPHVDDTLGWVYYMKGRSRDALPLLASAVEAQPTNVLFHYHLGMAYWKQGNPRAAREELTRAVTLSPSFAEREDAVAVLAKLNTKAHS